MDVLALTCGGSGRSFLHDRPGDGTDLGASRMGHLVGAGRHPADFNPGALVDLRELSGAAAIFEQRADANALRLRWPYLARWMFRWFTSRSGFSERSILSR